VSFRAEESYNGAYQYGICRERSRKYQSAWRPIVYHYGDTVYRLVFTQNTTGETVMNVINNIGNTISKIASDVDYVVTYIITAIVDAITSTVDAIAGLFRRLTW
jgi:hypothetical protein